MDYPYLKVRELRGRTYFKHVHGPSYLGTPGEKWHEADGTPNKPKKAKEGGA